MRVSRMAAQSMSMRMITIVRMVLQGVSVRRVISALLRLPFAVAVIVNIHLSLDYSLFITISKNAG